MLDITCFESDKKGISVGFIGGIHGNEVCGVKAINKLIADINANNITLKQGQIFCLPKANPKAFSEKKRYCEINLNRIFKEIDNPLKYEEKLAQEIISMIKKCDVIIDLHSNHTNSSPFIFQDVIDDETTTLINAMPIEDIICGWNDLYADSNELTTIDYAYSSGGYGITVECGKHNDSSAVDIGYDCLISALIHYDMIDVQNKYNPSNKNFLNLDSVVRKPKGGKFSKNWKHGDKIKAKEIIACDDVGNNYIAKQDGIICLPYADSIEGEEWYYLGYLDKKWMFL